MSQVKMRQFVVTPAMGKRLIGKALAVHAAVGEALTKGTVVIVAGTTNGYVAEEILKAAGQDEGFSRVGFRRGTVVPPNVETSAQGEFPGDVVLTDGRWERGKTIFDVCDQLRPGDLILKGANALDLARRKAAVYIGHPEGGTAGVAIRAVVGRRVRMIVPVGLEKRVCEDVADLAMLVNAPESDGPRLLPLPGDVFTELEAIETLTGGSACLLAGGGVHGAEGCVWIGVCGDDQQLRTAQEIISSVADEPLCRV
jgi:hypothetical protein